MAWEAACCSWAAVVCIHVMYGSTAVAIADEEGPIHSSPVRLEIADWLAEAVVLNSSARLLKAGAAAIIGAAPAPVYMRRELISGGSAPKSKDIASLLFSAGSWGARWLVWA